MGRGKENGLLEEAQWKIDKRMRREKLWCKTKEANRKGRRRMKSYGGKVWKEKAGVDRLREERTGRRRNEREEQKVERKGWKDE
jgi:hypothetical protein